MGTIEGTREQLLTAAERLFADRGIGAVSLREINKAAGQRNTSAIHYHFGSKEALVEAIFQRRMSKLNSERVTRLEAVQRSGRGTDLRAILWAIVSPLAEALEGGEGELNYLRFFSQALNETSPQVATAIRAPFSEGMRRGGEMVRAILSDIPAELLEERTVLATELAVHAIARRAQLIRSGLPVAERLPSPAFVENLVDFMVGGLAAETGNGAIFNKLNHERKTGT